MLVKAWCKQGKKNLPENHVGAQTNRPEQLCALQNDGDYGAVVPYGEGILAQDVDCGPTQHCTRGERKAERGEGRGGERAGRKGW